MTDLTTEIMQALTEYQDDIADGVKSAVDKVSAVVAETILQNITFKQRTGKYVSSFRVKTEYETRYNKKKTWHVANGEHRLSHLLEHGHETRNGKSTRAFKHIEYGDEIAQSMLPEMIKKVIEGNS